jgi:hypothetical protein
METKAREFRVTPENKGQLEVIRQLWKETSPGLSAPLRAARHEILFVFKHLDEAHAALRNIHDALTPALPITIVPSMAIEFCEKIARKALGEE